MLLDVRMVVAIGNEQGTRGLVSWVCSLCEHSRAVPYDGCIPLYVCYTPVKNFGGVLLEKIVPH